MTDIIPPEARKAAGVEPPPPGYVPAYFTYSSEDSVNLLDVWRALRAQAPAIAIIVAIFGTISVVAALLTTPVYRAEALLSPATQNKSDVLGGLGQLTDLAALAGISLGGGKDNTAESVATIKSRSTGMAFIHNEGLKPKLFSAKWDRVHGRWFDAGDVPTDMEAFELFDNAVRKVTVDRRTGLVSLAVEWTDPALAAQWANSLVKHVNDRRRAEAVADARKTIVYLEKQLASNPTVEIQQAIYRLIEAQTKTMTVAATREEYAFKVIDPAVAPERRVRPKRVAMVAGGTMLGLIVAILFVLGRHAVMRQRATV